MINLNGAKLRSRMLLFSVLAVVCMASLLIGCGGSRIADAVAAANSTRIQQLYNCYALFRHQNRYQGPKDEAAFKEFLRDSRYQKNLKLMQIDLDEIDDLFVSDRDGEPFKVRYGVNGLGSIAVIFESKGVNGKRMVALEKPIEVDEQEYEAYWSGKKRPSNDTSGMSRPE